MHILGIESSCDETAVAVVEDGRLVLSNVIASSVQEMAEFGGVVPESAARRQVEYILPVLEKGLQTSGMRHQDIDAIAVTKGPGLLTSLLVGTMTARVLASAWKKPLIGVHHTLGHLDSPWLEESDEISFPVLTLSVSGGHTELWWRECHTKGALLGKTRDDAAGEAFDKGAMLLGLPYPGGPALSKLAEGGNPHFIHFPKPLPSKESCDFSFSGLKTALKYTIRDRGGIEALSDGERTDTAASYQEAICDHLVSRIEHALDCCKPFNEIHLVGGVAANSRLRELLRHTCQSFTVRISHCSYCTDNAAMIAAAAYFMVQELGTKAYKLLQTEANMALIH